MRLDHRRLGLIMGGETVSFDLLIKGALVFTGPALRADVGVSEGRISAVEPRLPTQTAGEVLDAARLVLCPGFIDLHAHTALEPFRDPRLGLLERARADIDITFDQYPYGAGSTVLSALLPPWAREGGPYDTLVRLANPDQREAMQRDIERGLPHFQRYPVFPCQVLDDPVEVAAGERAR
jgi:N-acyl-D-aspartate/D-glutamate deacylase